jgi:hypothetical protein
MKLSQHHYSQDIATIKLRSVHQHWYVMISGAFGQRLRIMNDVIETFKGVSDVSLTEIQNAFVNAYQKYGRQLAAELVLAPYGLTLEEFISRRAELGDSIFERLWGEIGRIKVGCDFLVSGFDDVAHIFSVSDPTTEHPSFITNHDDLGFGTIGSGAYLAESTLYSYRQYVTNSIEETIFNTCAAKFSSESATDVGHATHIKVVQKDRIIQYEPSLSRELRDIWETQRPRITADALKIIKEAKRSIFGKSEPLP